MNKYELCKEIGNWFGDFFKENGKLCIDNHEKIFKYNTEDELLIDWLDTLIEADKATGDDYFVDVITFIQTKILNK